jgi:hypothetical protein
VEGLRRELTAFGTLGTVDRREITLNSCGPAIAVGPAMRSTALLLGILLMACGGKTLDVDEVSDAASDTGGSSDSGAADTARDLAKCTGPNTCSLVPTTCCGTCSQPTTENMTAVTRGLEAEHSKLVCGDGPVGCPACAPLIPDGSVQAWCVASRCKPIDVRKEPVSTCATDADCMLRHAPCCEPCDESPYDLVALNPTKVEAYRASVCAGDETCSKCLSRYPADTVAVCDPATKHCRVKSPFTP